MDAEFYRKLQAKLLDQRKQEEDKHKTVGNFLDALERYANKAAGQVDGIKVFVWGVDKNGEFAAHQYEDNHTGFNFELQMNIFDLKRNPLCRIPNTFTAAMSPTFIQVHFEDQSRLVPVHESTDEHHLRGVLEMIDAALKAVILGEFNSEL